MFKSVKKAAVLAALMVGFSAVTSVAMAGSLGTSADFGPVYTTINTWLTGDLGGIIALLIFGVGLGAGILKQSLGAVVVGLGGALAVANGPSVINSLLGAAMPVVHGATAALHALPNM